LALVWPNPILVVVKSSIKNGNERSLTSIHPTNETNFQHVNPSSHSILLTFAEELPTGQDVPPVVANEFMSNKSDLKNSETPSWFETDIVAFDLETTGAYPLRAEICEFGAVHWRGGKEIAQYQTLLKPNEKMSDFIIGIHGITNEMVSNAPKIEDKISEIAEFIKGKVLLAHHAPFDMGFLGYEFERLVGYLPTDPVICTSLLSRKLVRGTVNHKLQTLIPALGLPQESAHRAVSDARACLGVGLHCFKMLNDSLPLVEMGRNNQSLLYWNRFSLEEQSNSLLKTVVKAIKEQKKIEIIYMGGSHSGKTREVFPEGVVRNPQGDYMQAICQLDQKSKKFYFDKIKDAAVIN
jgi:DNA polymerase III subunit epsilon